MGVSVVPCEGTMVASYREGQGQFSEEVRAGR